MPNLDIYESKYLKYKAKYNALKNHAANNHVMHGGAAMKDKLYLFKAGEFLRVKTLFHLPFLSSGFFSNNFVFSKSRFLANANTLSPIIPIFFLILQLSIIWNETDLTGQ